MRKLKLLFAALALLVGVGSANAYTVDDLTSAGWTKVTTSPITNVNDNYFMLVDCNSSNYVMANQADHFRPCYKTIANPVDNPSFVWILEGSDNEFALKSYSTGAYFKQASGWNTSVGYARDSRTKVTGVFEISGGKYTLKCKESGDYVGHWNDNGAAVESDGENIAANKAIGNAPGFYLYSISRATFDAALAASRLAAVSTATKASPASVTSYIQNADWSGDWGGWESSFTSSGNMQWGQQTLESWNASNVIIKQELRGIPNGTYKLTADLISGNSDNKVAYVFATGDTKVSSDAVSAEASAGDYNTMSSEVAGKTLTADNVVVTGNTITVGIDQSSGWIVADNFTLSYYGPNLAVSAALPAGDMTADTWYYFDIAIDGVYNLSYTNLSDIVYATDGSILVEDAASITTNFTGSSVNLTSGRYYVKSSSAQTLGVAPASYSYHVGTPTSSISDGSYLQSLTSVTFTLGEAASNDGTASLAIQGTPVAKLNDGSSDVADGALTISGNVVTATYTSVTLDPAKTYTITLPANTVAWDKNTENKNTAKVITFKTPAVFDGHFYIKKDGADLFFSRGGDDNKQAVLDQFGVPVKITTDESNVTRVKFVDTGLLLGASGSSTMYWTDKGDGTPSTVNWTIAKSGEKFKFYLMGMEDAKKGMSIDGDAPKSDTEANACDWELELPAAHPAKLQAVKDAQAAAVATAMSIDGVTTQAQMAAKLAADYGTTDIAITGTGGTNKESWQGSASTGTGNELAVFAEETVNGLAPGLYRLRVHGFERIAGGQAVYDAGGAAGLAYVYATSNSKTEKVKLASLFDVQSDTQWQSGNDLQFGGKYYANSQTGAQAAFDAGNYANDVYVQVVDEGAGTGSIKFGIKQPNCYYSGSNAHNNAQWICFNNFSLTLFEAKATDEQKTALTAAITAAEAKTLGFENGEYAPYTNVAALEALAAAKAINTETASGSAVTAATSALTGATWTANATDVECVYNGNFAEGQGSPAANIQQYGWTRTNAWGQFQNDGFGSTTAYYNQPGSMQYGNAGVYTMPLKAQTIYRLQFKYAKWDGDYAPTVSVLNGEDGMAAQTFANASSNYKNGYNSVDMVFVTATAGNYVLSISGSSNYVITGVSITKAANQYLEFADGSVPSYAPGTYPTVKITRTLTAGKWATAVYPFAVSDVDKIAVLDSYNKSTGALGFTTATESTANVPFLMRSTADKSEISLSNVKVAAAAATDAMKNEASLKGVYAATTVDNSAKNYVLSNNVIYPIGANSATVNPYRAYIQIAQDADPARGLTFTVDGETTAIDGITAGENAEDGAVYNLQGQRVVKAQKGLYIKDGRKVMVK